MIAWRISGALLLGGIALAGCKTDNPAYVDPAVCEEGETFARQIFDLADGNRADILFVIDDSPGMLQRQRALADAMPAFIETLNERAGLDWRIGIVGTDFSRAGQLRTGIAGQPGCPDRLPEVVQRSTTQAGLVASCNVVLGEDGSDFEQAFKSAYAYIAGALTSDRTDPLLRPDARLIVIVFSDEDDCSATGALDRGDPDNCLWQPTGLEALGSFASAFDGSLLREKRGWAGQPVSFVAITGPADGVAVPDGVAPTPVCTVGGPVFAGNRHLAMAQRVGTDHLLENICTPRFDETLRRIARQAVHHESDTLCLARATARPPVNVVLLDGNTEAERLSENGDFLSLGPTEDCPNGAIAVSTQAHGAGLSNRVDIRFCAQGAP